MNAADIAGYTYQADVYCPDCISQQVNGAAQRFGTVPGPVAWETTEEYLARIANMMGIDPEQEETYDSDDFPKVVFVDQCCDGGEHTECGRCGEDLLGHDPEGDAADRAVEAYQDRRAEYAEERFKREAFGGIDRRYEL
jgi:hypothetical protein